MLFELTDEEIKFLKIKYDHAFEALQHLLQDKKVFYPLIKYSSKEASWIEFDKCFNKKFIKHYAKIQTVKYKEGKTYLRCL